MSIGSAQPVGVAVLLLTSIPLLSRQAPPKVAVLRAESLITEHPDYQQAQETFARQMNEQTSRLQAKRDELLAAQQALTTAPPTLDSEARIALVLDAEQLQTEADRMAEDVRSVLNALQEELLLSVYDAVDAAVLSYVEEEGFDLVLDASNPVMGVLYMDDMVDITDAILERMAEAPTESVPGPATDPPPQE